MTCASCQPLQEQVRLLREQIAKLEQRNTELQHQINTLRSYIWKPNRPEPAEPKHPGPKAGHEPHNRPPPEIHETRQLSLKQCPDCGTRLGRPVRVRERIVEDIRPHEPVNTRFLVPVYYCPACRKQVAPQPAEAVPKCRFGLRLLLFVTYLRYGSRLPLNKIAQLLEAMAGIRISEGCLVDALTRFAKYAGPQFAEIRDAIKREPVVNLDETGWPVNGRRQWLWDFVSASYTLLLIRDSRAQAVVYQILGKDYAGISVNDGAKMYDRLGWRQQTCWAHLLRYTRRLESREGRFLHCKVTEIYRLAKSRRMGKARLHAMVDRLIAHQFTAPHCQRFVKHLAQRKGQLFTFLSQQGMDGTNNAAERGLRPSVVMRKISGGNRSPKGAVNHEVIMSVMGTWEKQGKDFFEEGRRLFGNVP